MNFIKDKENYDYIIKAIILGKDSIGKTIFFQRIKLLDDYKSFKKECNNYYPTIGIDLHVFTIKFNNKLFRFQLWDTAGQERFSSIIKAYYKVENLILIFYDAFDKESFEKAKAYYEQTFKMNDKGIYFLIRCKYELSSNSEKNDFISDEEALKFTEKKNLFFAHVSSFEKNENGIKEVFELFLKEYALRNSKI